MALTLQQIRDHVRLHMDLELEDLPDEMVDQWVREGFNRIVVGEQRWPYYETLGTTELAAALPYLPLEGLNAELKRISHLVRTDDAVQVEWISMQEAHARFKSTDTGAPQYYSLFANILFWFPTPDAATSVTWFGYRKPTDWMEGGAGAVPDIPEELHETLVNWVLFRGYAQQEDPELAHNYQQLFDNEVNEFGRRMTEMPLNRPLIMNRVRR